MKFDLKFPGEAPYISPETQIDIFNAIKKDSTLPNNIQAMGKAKKPSEFRKILLTGVTGHLGPYLLQQLSQQENLSHIFCLVRASSTLIAQARGIKSLRESNLIEKSNLNKIHFLQGDIAEKNLGLDENAYSILSNIIDAVVHNAVYSNHVKSYPLSENNHVPEKCPLRAVNVTGVKNILEFAAEGVTKHVLHGSSFTCVNRLDHSGRLIEELPDEDNLGDGIAMGYACSKFVGEKLMKTALEERGIPVTVIRYPTICGDSKTGFIADLDNVTMVAMSFFCVGLFPADCSAMCVCPADICAQIATELFFKDESPTGAYNLFPPAGTMDEVYDVALKNGVTPIRKSSYEEYMHAVLNSENTSNQILLVFKKIYSQNRGLKEFYGLCPAMRLLWHDPSRYSGWSRKLDEHVPGSEKWVPTTQQCLQNLIDFFNTTGVLTQLGININSQSNRIC